MEAGDDVLLDVAFFLQESFVCLVFRGQTGFKESLKVEGLEFPKGVLTFEAARLR